jgi:putative RNA 2'-phosphotransferase
MNQNQRIKLSKLMSVALRHDPASFSLALDQDGWVLLETLLAGLHTRPGWSWVQLDDVREVVETSDKQRFELAEGRIRARYGHSQAARPSYQPVEPPAILYHGTPRRNLPLIRRSGLKPMSRQYVHLSARPEMAHEVGRRRDAQPVILTIRAAEAYTAGIPFGTPSGGQDEVYLVESLPPDFIDFPE